jgi:tetratricopeptide (TPR) repeat protein
MGKLQQETGALNEGDELRGLIADAEKLLASLSAAGARELMTVTTEAQHLLFRLDQSGSDVRPEAARLDTIQQRIIKQARQIVDGVGGERAFVTLREKVNPGTPEAWWQLESVLAAQRAQRLKQVAAAVVATLLILVVGYVFRGVLFPPDPIGDAVNAAQRALQVQDVPAAQQALDLGLSQFPTNTTLLIWQANVLELRNDPRAAEVIATARANAQEPRFSLEKSQIDLQFGQDERVIAEMTMFINRFPEQAEAYFLRASAYENKRDVSSALTDLKKASDIAQRQGNDTLYATARIRLGTLMQSGAAQGQPAP